LTYLYFAPIQERLPIHHAEKLLSPGHNSPFISIRTKKNQDDILNFRPYFDEAFAKHKIVSIASMEFLSDIWNLSDRSAITFIKRIQTSEKKKRDTEYPSNFKK
jgi:hypothetical protein